MFPETFQSEDALLVRDAARRFLAGIDITSTGVWRAMADLGWHGLLLPEQAGGLQLQVDAALALAEEAGRALLLAPLVEVSLSTGGFLAEVGGAPDVIADIIAGQRRFCLVGAQNPLSHVNGRIEGWVRRVELGTGESSVTDLLILVNEDDVLRVLRVATDAPGLKIRPYRSLDGRTLADIGFADLAAGALSVFETNADLNTARAHYLVLRRMLLAAETVGAMQRCNELTADYLGQRKQFGKALAEFQALAHRVAEMRADTEMVITMADALMPTPGQVISEALADRALAVITRLARTVGETSIQLHGGMGMTDEMLIGRYFKRLLYLSTALGGETAPRARIAERCGAEIRALAEGA